MSISWANIDSYKGNYSSPELLSYRQCPICASPRNKTVMVLNDFLHYTDSTVKPKLVEIHQRQCRDCYAIYMNPCYSSYGFKVLFEEAGQSYILNKTDEQIEWLKNKVNLTDGIKLLDVGCHNGMFLSKLPDYVKRTGIDINQSAIEDGRRRFRDAGIELICDDFETFQYQATPDVITMFNVLEHFPRPLIVLRNLRSMAHPSTRLIVEVPLLENGITKDINGFLSVHHLTHFSRNSLENCLLQAGWQIIEQDEQAHYNGCRISAIPSKAVLTIKGEIGDIKQLYKYFSAYYDSLQSANAVIEQHPIEAHCVIWGGGTHTEILYHTTSLFHANRRKYIIVDSDPLKQGKTWRGIKIYSPTVLKSIDWANANLIVSSYGSQEAILREALKLNVPKSKIILFYSRSSDKEYRREC